MSRETWVDVAVYNQNSLNQNLANKRNNTPFYAKIFFPKKNHPTSGFHLKRKKRGPNIITRR